MMKQAGEANSGYEILRILFDQMHDAFFLADVHLGAIVDANQRACLSLGYTREELLTLKVHHIETTIPDGVAWERIIQQVRVAGGSALIAGRQRRKDGTTFPVEVSGKLVRIDKEYLIVTVRDISERIADQRALEEYREKWTVFFERAPILILSVDPGGAIIDCNDQARAFLGYEQRELIGKQISSIIPPDKLSAAYETLREILSVGHSSGKEIVMVRKDGTTIDVLTNSTGLKDETGAYSRTLCLISDISSIKKAKDALAREHDLLQTYLRVAGVIILALSPDGTIRLINDRGCQVLGYERPEELIGKNWFDQCLHPDEKDRVRRIHTQNMRSGKTMHARVENSILTAQGEKRLISWQNVVLTDETGRAIGTVSSGEDVTDERYNQERLREINECLLSLGSDFFQNVNRITALCGELLRATCALYNRLDNKLLCSQGQWQTPPDLKAVSHPEGHICYDVIRKAERASVYVPDLPSSSYARTDPNVMAYGLKTYLGHVVMRGETAVGSLCVVYCEDRVPTEEDKQILGILAAALGAEESRYQVTGQLESSEARYRTISGMTSDYFYSCLRSSAKEEFRVDWVAGPFERITGYSDSELLRQGCWLPFVHPSDRDRVRAYLHEAVTGKQLQCEFRLIKKDGQVIWLRDVGSCQADDQRDGWIRRFGAATDITGRKEIEEKVLGQIRFLQVLLDAIPAPVFYKNTQGRYIGCNVAFEKFLHKTRDQIVGKTVYEVAPRQIAQKYFEKDSELFAHPGEQSYEWQVRNDAGEERVVIFHKATFTDQAGAVAGLIGTITDVSERKQVEERMRFFRKLVDRVDDAIFMVEPRTGRVIDANETMVMRLGYTREEFLTLRVPDFEAQLFLHRSWDEAAAEMIDKRELSIGGEHRRKDGTTFPVELSLQSVRYEGNDYIVGLARDISERQRAEQAIRFRMALERMSVETITALAKAPIEQIDMGIGAALAKIGGFFRVDRARLFLFDERKQQASLFKEWCSDPAFQTQENFGRLSLQAVLPYASGILFEKKPFLCSAVTGLPAHARAEKAFFSRQGVQSCLLLPLIAQDTCIGFIGVESLTGQQPWEEDIVGTLTLIAEVVGVIVTRSKIQQSLQESEERFKAITSMAQDAIILADSDDAIVFWNAAAERLFGYTAEEARTRSLRELIVPAGGTDAGVKQSASFGMTADSPAPGTTVELSAFAKKGEAFPVELSLSRVQIRSSWYTIGIMRDISGRKRAEAALRASEQKFSKAFLSSGDMMIISSLETGRLIEINAMTTQILGFSYEELIGKTSLELNLWADPAERGRFSREIVRQGHLRDFETVLRKKTQETFPVSVSAERIVLGAEECILSAFRDISARKQAEESLRQSEARYRAVVDHVNIGVSLIDAGMRVVFLNERMQSWFPAIDVAQRPHCYEVFYDPPRPGICADCPSAKTFADGKVHEVTISNTVAGAAVSHRIISSPVHDGAGRVVAVVELIEDVTERTRLEEQQRQHLRDLETFEEVTIGREARMIELKKEVNRLSRELGHKEPYDLTFLPEQP